MMTDFPNPEDLNGFDEIRRLLRELPGPDLEAASAVATREAQLTKPAGALGRLEDITQWLATWQGRKQPRINRPRITVFAANHGVAAKGVSAYPSSVTRQMVDNFLSGGAAVNQLVGVIDGDLRVYELDLDNPTADFTQEPAMSEAACAQAMAYGMMAVEQGIDVIGLGEMGIGNTTSAAALCLGLFGGTAEDWVGPGTGVSGEALTRKIAAVQTAYDLHKPACGSDGLAWLAAVGGLELAAIAGAVVAARLAKTPVLLDGFVSTAAAAVIYAIDPRALDHCLVAHVSAEPGHRRLIAKLGQEPLLDLGMRLGEGSGAALAVSLLRAAATCHSGMATFGQAGVSGPV
jgi:nicotinate-nucleotide--dimethylbenzimidazole phosphoribosyltransferase